VHDAQDGYEAYMTVDVMRAYTEYVDDLSNWYIRRSRRRFWDGEREALSTLWYALVQTLRVMAPIMPFITDHLWRNLVPDGPESVHLAPWPEVEEPDRDLLAEIADVRRVVALAHQARATSGLKLRQPLRRLVIEGANGSSRHAAEIADEVRVKDVAFDAVEAELRVSRTCPFSARDWGRSCPRSSGRCRPGTSRSWRAAASASPATSSSRTRCSLSAPAARASPSPRPRG